MAGILEAGLGAAFAWMDRGSEQGAVSPLEGLMLPGQPASQVSH